MPHSSVFENEMLHQSLVGYFEVDTLSARASDTILLIDDQLTDEVHGLMIMLCCWTTVCCLYFTFLP